MNDNIQALVIQSGRVPLEALRLALQVQSIDVLNARNCAEAALLLWSERPLHIVFTDVQLTDGNWADVLTLAAKARKPVNVIVIAPYADIGLYLEALERGAFDFVVPPLSGAEFGHVIRTAAENVLARQRQAAAPPSSLVTVPESKDPQGEQIMLSDDWVVS